MNNAKSNYNAAVYAYNDATIKAGYGIADTRALLLEELPRVQGLTWAEYKRLPRVGSRFRLTRAMRRVIFDVITARAALDAAA